jgi:transketolase
MSAGAMSTGVMSTGATSTGAMSTGVMSAATMRARFADVTSELLDADPRLAVVLADISTDLFRSARRRHPDRVVNVGIREQLLIGVAGGLALAGLRPIVHTYAPFLVERPFEQVKLDLGHQDVGAVLVSIGASHDWAAGGRTHHAPGDVALLDTLGGWTVHVPGHPAEVERILRQAAAARGRVYIRLSEQVNARAFPTDEPFHVIRTGAAATVLAVGPMLDPTLEATDGLDVTVLYASTIRPFDGGGLRRVLRSPDVVLVEPYREGTSVAVVTAALRDIRHRVLAIGVTGHELRRYGTREEHDAARGLTPASIRERIDDFLVSGYAPRPEGRPPS